MALARDEIGVQQLLRQQHALPQHARQICRQLEYGGRRGKARAGAPECVPDLLRPLGVYGRLRDPCGTHAPALMMQHSTC